jgi:hypothetical protein
MGARERSETEQPTKKLEYKHSDSRKTMANRQLLDVQQGIWIDKQWLQQAGLGGHLQIVVQQGEIRILAASEETKQSDSPEEIWTEETREVFRSLGGDAVSGKLKDSSLNHDLYLYGKTE